MPGVNPEVRASLHLGREHGRWSRLCLGSSFDLLALAGWWGCGCVWVLSCRSTVLVRVVVSSLWGCCVCVVGFWCWGCCVWLLFVSSVVWLVCRDFFSCRCLFCTSAVITRCMVDALNIRASWIRVMTAWMTMCIDLVVLASIGA